MGYIFGGAVVVDSVRVVVVIDNWCVVACIFGALVVGGVGVVVVAGFFCLDLLADVVGVTGIGYIGSWRVVVGFFGFKVIGGRVVVVGFEVLVVVLFGIF